MVPRLSILGAALTLLAILPQSPVRAETFICGTGTRSSRFRSSSASIRSGRGPRTKILSGETSSSCETRSMPMGGRAMQR